MSVYITLLSSNDYILPVLALNQNLIDLHSKYPLMVITTANIDTEILEALTKNHIQYKLVKPINYHKDLTRVVNTWDQKQVINTASKLEIFNVDYDKAVYLDTDSFFIHNIDNLMDYPDGAMYEECGCEGGFSGLFTYIPQNHNFEYYKSLLQNFPILDGDLFANLWFPFKSNPAYRIPTEYFLNITLDNLDNHIQTAKGFHFCYKYKPWNYNSVEEFNKDFYSGLPEKPYSKVRSAVVETYLERYILPLKKNKV